MHMCCLGTFKRFMTILARGFGEYDRQHVLNQDEKEELDKETERLKKHLPKEFHRKGRPLKDLCRWKAVEFRLSFLYTGLITLRNVLTPEKYDLFLKFVVAMRILLSPNPTKPFIKFAGQLLERYSFLFAEKYGLHHLTYNLHGLLHLASDCLCFGSLNEVSCFPYENFLYKLKRLIRGRRKPLAQLFKKTYQLERETTLDWLDARRNETMMDTVRGSTTSDSFVLVKPGLVVKISGYIGNHVLATPVIMEMGEHGNYQKIFTSPFPATKLDIYVGQGLDHGNLMQILKADINKGKKCVTLPYEDVQGDVKFLVLPLLHHY